MHPTLADPERPAPPSSLDPHEHMTDVDERLLLRSTAREVFASGPTPADIVALGWLGLLTAERVGGEGWFPYEAALIALEGGRAGSPSTWSLCALAAACTSHAPEGPDLTAGLLSGDLVGTYAYAPDVTVADQRASGTAPRVLCDRLPDIVMLTGVPSLGPLAVAVGQGGAELHSDVTALETERVLFRLTMDRTPVRVIEPGSAAALELSATVLLCADTVGAVERALRLVTRHLVEREAFGVPIASFQAVQHRLVALATFHSAAEALLLSAAGALGQGRSDAERLALAAHAYIENRAVRAVDDCIQLAGGIGFTWEFPVHHVLRRTSTNAALLGPGRTSRERLAAVKGRTR